jgi:hypothetical protein
MVREDDDDFPAFVVLLQILGGDDSAKTLDRKAAAFIDTIRPLPMAVDRGYEVFGQDRGDLGRRQAYVPPDLAQHPKGPSHVIREGLGRRG